MGFRNLQEKSEKDGSIRLPNRYPVFELKQDLFFIFEKTAVTQWYVSQNMGFAFVNTMQNIINIIFSRARPRVI